MTLSSNPPAKPQVRTSNLSDQNSRFTDTITGKRVLACKTE